MYRLFFFLFIAFHVMNSFSQSNSEKILIVSPNVGETIDSLEKKQYHLFPYFLTSDYISGTFYKGADSVIVLRVHTKKGDDQKNISEKEFEWIRNRIDLQAYQSTKERKTYLNVGLGYGLGFPVQSLHINEVKYANGATQNYNVSGTFGEGFNFEFGIGSKRSKNLSLELNFNYLEGIELSSSDVDYTAQIYDYRVESISMLRVIPTVKFFIAGESRRFYLKEGIIFGVFGSVSQYDSTIQISNNIKYVFVEKSVENGGVSIGVMSAAGLEFPLGKNLMFNVEVRYIGQSYFPSNGELLSLTENGSSIMNRVSNKKVEFVDTISGGSQRLGYHYPLSSISLNMGLHIDL